MTTTYIKLPTKINLMENRENVSSVPSVNVENAKQKPWEFVNVTEHIQANAADMYRLLAEINHVFYVEGTRKAMIEVMAKTRPMLKKARGEA